MIDSKHNFRFLLLTTQAAIALRLLYCLPFFSSKRTFSIISTNTPTLANDAGVLRMHPSPAEGSGAILIPVLRSPLLDGAFEAGKVTFSMTSTVLFCVGIVACFVSFLSSRRALADLFFVLCVVSSIPQTFPFLIGGGGVIGSVPQTQSIMVSRKVASSIRTYLALVSRKVSSLAYALTVLARRVQPVLVNTRFAKACYRLRQFALRAYLSRPVKGQRQLNGKWYNRHSTDLLGLVLKPGMFRASPGLLMPNYTTSAMASLLAGGY